MPARKQYSLNQKVACINRKELEKRKGKKWKQLEKLEELDKGRSSGEGLFGNLITEYGRIKDLAVDDEVLELARLGLVGVAKKCRNDLLSRFDRSVIYHQTETLKRSLVLDMFYVRFSMNKGTFKILKEDIRKKGIIVPILITEDMEIIDGYYRWKASKELLIPTVPCSEINMEFLPEHHRVRLIIDLWISNNLLGRHLSKEDYRSLKRYYNIFTGIKVHSGRHTKEEQELFSEFKIKGLEGMDANSRHIFNLFRMGSNE